jgi:hypothetical protein
VQQGQTPQALNQRPQESFRDFFIFLFFIYFFTTYFIIIFNFERGATNSTAR